jgi:hypothetical protein
MRDDTVLAKEPTAAITIFLGMPLRWSDFAAHSIVRDIFTADDYTAAVGIGSDSKILKKN